MLFRKLRNANKKLQKVLDNSRQYYISQRQHREFLKLLESWEITESPAISRFSLISDNISPQQYLEIMGDTAKKEIIERADKILQNCLSPFSQIEITPPGEIDWHRDYLSGFRYRPKYYQSYRLRNLKRPDDPKIPWELSRFHYGVTLAQAYFLTNDLPYKQRFMELLRHWCQNNPWKIGVNWTCAMEVAIRAGSWCTAWQIIAQSQDPALPKQVIRQTLQHHIQHIYENMEWSQQATTNHYLSNLWGLFVIGNVYPLPQYQQIKEFAVVELQKEMLKQFYKDGGNWESSTTYQRFVCEMLLFVATIAKREKIELSEQFHAVLQNSITLLLEIANPQGRIPTIGDNDSGRFLEFVRRNDDDIRHISVITALLYDTPKYLEKSWGFPEECYWLFGHQGYLQYQKLCTACQEIPKQSQAFVDTGIYLMKSSGCSMVISAMPNGQNGCGGHCHNDKLAFTLATPQQNILIDRGTFAYNYDLQIRRELRATSSHNTLRINKQEQNRFIENALYHIHEDAQITVRDWKTTPLYDIFVADHSGYHRLSGTVQHTRSIGLARKNLAWLIADKVEYLKPGTNTSEYLELFFYSALPADLEQTAGIPSVFNELARELKLETVLSPNTAVTIPSEFGTIWIVQTTPNMQLSIKKSWYSPSYRVQRDCTMLHYQITTTLPTNIITLIWVELC